MAPVLLAGALAACGGGRRGAADRDGSAAGNPEARVPLKSIDEVLAAHSDSLMALPGVVGTAIGLCGEERCIKVFVTDSGAATRRNIPERIEGYGVSVEVTGPFRPR
jgi:hypothetical protein